MMRKNVVFDFYRVIYIPENNSLDKDILNILASLKKDNIPLYLFTNTREEVIKELDKENNFLKYFNEVIYNTEYPKPDVKSFEKLINTINSDPFNIIFVDDSPLNVSVAEEFGIITIPYIGSEDLCIKLNNILKNDK